MNSFNLGNGLPLQKLDQPSFKGAKMYFFRKATKKQYLQLALSKGDQRVLKSVYKFSMFYKKVIKRYQNIQIFWGVLRNSL